MLMPRRLFFITIAFLMLTGNFTMAQEKEFSWPDGKKAAVCMTYDDGIDSHLNFAIP